MDKNDDHHLLRLKDTFIHRQHLCLVFELLSVNLYELIKQNQFQGLSTQLVKVFTAQLLDALTILKEARLIHCDLKPENILCSADDSRFYLSDFGLATQLELSSSFRCGSSFYMSPGTYFSPFSSALTEVLTLTLLSCRVSWNLHQENPLPHRALRRLGARHHPLQPHHGPQPVAHRLSEDRPGLPLLPPRWRVVVAPTPRHLGRCQRAPCAHLHRRS